MTLSATYTGKSPPSTAEDGDLYVNPEEGTLLIYGSHGSGGTWVELTEHDPFAAFQTQHPRAWWALTHMENDKIRDRILESIHRGNVAPEDIDLLWTIAAEIEVIRAAKREGRWEPAPVETTRGEWEASPTSFEDVELQAAKKTKKVSRKTPRRARVNFMTPEGWGGYFETNSMRDLKLLKTKIGHSVKIKGTVRRRLSDVKVQLNATPRCGSKKTDGEASLLSKDARRQAQG